MEDFKELKKAISKDVILSTREKTNAQVAVDSLAKILPESIFNAGHPLGKIISLRGPFLFRFLIHFDNVLLKLRAVNGFGLKVLTKDKENFYSLLLEFEMAYELYKNSIEVISVSPTIYRLTPDLLLREVTKGIEFIVEVTSIGENKRTKAMEEDFMWLRLALSPLHDHFHINGNFYEPLGEAEKVKINSWINSLPPTLNSEAYTYKTENLELTANSVLTTSIEEKGVMAHFYKDDYIENTLITKIATKIDKYTKLLASKRKLIVIVSNQQIFYYVKNKSQIIRKIEGLLTNRENVLAVILHAPDFGYSQDRYLYSNITENHELIIKSKEDYSWERFWIIGSERSEDKILIETISNVLKTV